MERITSTQLLDTIRNDRERFDATLARVPLDRFEEPSLPGGWSVKDVLAHVAWGDRENIGVARARALAGSDLWQLTEDERNAEVVRQGRRLSLDAVLADYRGSFSEYVAAIAALSDEDLNDPQRIEGLPDRSPGWLPWRILYDPDHYSDHRKAIEAAFALGET